MFLQPYVRLLQSTISISGSNGCRICTFCKVKKWQKKKEKKTDLLMHGIYIYNANVQSARSDLALDSKLVPCCLLMARSTSSFRFISWGTVRKKVTAVAVSLTIFGETSSKTSRQCCMFTVSTSETWGKKHTDKH